MFIEHTESGPSSELHRKWGAIGAVAGALERKVWIHSFGEPFYANMFTILLGPPGAGKTFVVKMIGKLWREIGDHFVAPSSVTRASLIDELIVAKRNVITPSQQVLEFNSLLLASNELGTLLPSYDNDFMSVLTDIWDGEPYGESRRTKEIKHAIPAPQINLLAATTPSWLFGFLPEGAWDQGFLARTMVVYSGEIRYKDPFADINDDVSGWNTLVGGLREIGNLYGKCVLEPAARAFLSRFALSGGKPAPTHPRLTNYVVRRTAHLIKLSMVHACARRSLVIDEYDVRRAYNDMIELETYMEDIFKAMKSGGDVQATEDAYHLIFTLYMRDKNPVSEHILVQALAKSLPSTSVRTAIEVMVRGGWLQLICESGKPNRYVPLPRENN